MASFGCYDNFDVIATRIITNFHLYLIQLLWQFFQMFVYGVVVYAQKNFTGIDPEKLYRATFICWHDLCCCIVWPSFLFVCFVKIWATCKNFLGKWFKAPLGKKFPVRLCMKYIVHHSMCIKGFLNSLSDRSRIKTRQP